MKGWIVFASLIAVSSALTAEIVNSMKEDLRAFMNSNSRYIGRGVRLGKLTTCLIFAGNLEIPSQFL